MAPNPINNKKSVLGVVKEVSEATPVRPSAATHFTALQEGFSMDPQLETLVNNEIRASIGKSKDEIGSESPTFTFSHYLKASGVAGQAPDYGLFVESCLGAVVIDSAERSLTTGSTISVLKLASGGSNYQRGQAVLSQKSGEFRIRNVLSVNSNDLTLAQVLPNAPLTGTLIGRAVLYKVLDEGHPTLSIWNYRGNGGCIEMLAGGRVTEMSLEANANEYINTNFTVGGVKYYFNPIKISSTNKFLDFTDDDGDHAISIEEKEYRSPIEVVDAINAALASLSLSDAITVEYLNTSGKFKFTSVGTLFELLWNSGANAANSIGSTLGFLVASDDTGAVTYTSDNAQSWAASFSPDFDDTNANVAKANEVMLGDAEDTGCFGAQRVSVRVANTKTDIPDLCEESGKSGSLFTAREVTVEITALLQKHDVDKYDRFQKGTKTMFTYNFGIKQGGQWKKNNCVNVFVPSATITAFKIDDQEGMAILNATLTAYVEDGQGEFYMNFI